MYMIQDEKVEIMINNSFGFGTVSDAIWKPLGSMLKSPTEKSIFYISTQSAIGVGQQGAGKVISNQQKK